MSRVGVLGVLVVLASCSTMEATGTHNSDPKVWEDDQRERGEAWRKLLIFQGQDLGVVDSRGEFNELFSRVTYPQTIDPYFKSCRPVAIGTVGTGSSARVLVLEWERSGFPKAIVHFFDLSGHHLAGRGFGPGRWPADILAVRFMATVRGFSVMDVATSLGRQVYAILNDDLVLVRLEDKNGIPLRNCYALPFSMVGPPPPRWGVSDWEEGLQSKNAVERLRTLVWLGGDHGSPKSFPEPVESYEEVLTWRAVRTGERAKAALAELVKSDDPWIREAAQLAARE